MGYFFDTYAIVEIVRGNPNYNYYLGGSFLITQLNLIELHYIFLKESPETADVLIEKYAGNVIPLSNEIIKKANRFRLYNKKKDFSTADAIGYICAKEKGMVFVTGDRQFEGLPNVEFVK